MINERTAYLDLQQPHPANTLDQDIGRIRASFDGLDAALATAIQGVLMGVAPGWNWSLIGDPVAPSAETWASGARRVRIEYTYAGDRVSSMRYRVSTNSGTTYLELGTRTIAYDGLGYLTAITWS